MKHQAIIWDLDGTLLDTLQDLTASVNAALQTQGCPKRTLEEVRSFVGNGVRNLMLRAMPEGREDLDFEALFRAFRAHYAEHDNDATAPYPGVMPLLQALHAKGIAMAVVSNKLDRAVKKLCAAHFGGMIPVAIGDREGVPRKPAPDSVLEAMELLGAADAIYIGDSEVDIATAKNAGLPCICVSWGFRPEEALRAAGAEEIAPNADALMALLDRRIAP